ncbi:MAG: hypothetical protein HOH95_12635, partial [Dehalococcoidia bacterium]|nr:hypothetical protein [Dehalococcoidia bacterium]
MAKTHGVVVIHGQGQARFRGAILAQLLNGTIGALEAGGYDVERTIELDQDIPRARLALTSAPPLAPNGSPSPLHGEAIEFREAFWDDAFPAPSTDDVVRWVLMGIRSRAAGMLSGWFGQPRTVAANGFSILDWIAKAQTLLLTIMLAASLLLTSIIQPIAWLLFTASRMPIVSGFGIAARFGAAIQSLNPFLQSTLGDSQRLVTDRAWAATIRTRLETPLIELLDNDDISHVTIVAHSAGAAVAYEALFQGSPVAKLANEREKPIRLITMGSGLNHLWAFASMRNNGVPERVALAEGRLDPDVVARAGDTRTSIDTFWTDLYARFDYVAAGPTGAQIVAHSGLEDGKHFRAHRVINYDHLIDDHGGYFRNKEQVIPRLLPVIVNRITWWRTQPPPEEGT